MIQETTEGVILTIHIQPKGARTEYVGIHGDALKFRVAAPPVDGSANHELCRFLAMELKVATSAVLIQSGQKGRRKRILVKAVSKAQVQEVLHRNR